MTEPEFEQLVQAHYATMYRFALSLTGQESDACDLTQQTFYICATKGHQLRELSRRKAWLFTTLYREFLKGRRRAVRFPEHELSVVEPELPQLTPDVIDRMDAEAAMAVLMKLDEPFRVPLALFYLDDHSYNEIAEILDIPAGTVMSRIARGKEQIRRLLADPQPARRTADTSHIA